MRVIAFAGAARSGKNTAAAMTAIELTGLGYSVIAEGFADRLKVSAARALGFDGTDHGLVETMDMFKVCGSVESRVEWGPNDVQESRLTGREFLQHYGTEAHRDVFGADFWLDAVVPVSEAEGIISGSTLARDDADFLLVTDLRFENEAQRVLDVGGEVWEIHRPDLIKFEASHSSEAPLAPRFITRTLPNIGDLLDLRELVRLALKGFDR